MAIVHRCPQITVFPREGISPWQGGDFVHKMSTVHSFFWRGFSRRGEGNWSKIIDIYLTYYLLYIIIYQYIIYKLTVNNPYNRKPPRCLLWGPRKNCGLWTTVDNFDDLRHPFARIGCRDPYPNKLFTKCPQMSTDYSFFPLPDKTKSCWKGIFCHRLSEPIRVLCISYKAFSQKPNSFLVIPFREIFVRCADYPR